MQSQSKEVQGKAVEALSIMSKGSSASPEDVKRAEKLLEDMMKVGGTLRGSDRAAFSKIIVDLQKMTTGKPGEMTGNISNLGDSFRSKANSITAAMNISKKMLASKAQATEFSRRLNFELISDDNAGAKKNILAYLDKKGIKSGDLEDILKKVGDLGDGDVGENLMAFGKMYGEKKYTEIFAAMKLQGGAYEKIANLGAGLAASRELQGRDLLDGVLKKDKNLKDIISGSGFKGALSNRKAAKDQYLKLMGHLKKYHKGHQGDLSKIEQSLDTIQDDREKLVIMKKIIEGTSTNEGDFLSRIQLRNVSGKVAGTTVSGSSSAGTYSRVAAKQIAATEQVLQNLRIQHQTMKALYQQIKNGGKI